MHRIELRAIVLASLAVFGVDFVSSFLLISLFGGAELHPSRTDAQLQAAMHVLLQNPRYLACTLICGTASTVLGGFLAARLAPALPYFNALAFGLVGLVLSVLAVEDVPTWFMIAGFGLTLPAALLGGHLAQRGSRTGS